MVVKVMFSRSAKELSRALAVVCLLGVVPAFPSAAASSLAPVQDALSAGSNTTCAIRADNDVYCVGDNSYGQLGDGSLSSSSQPKKVLGLNGAQSVSVGKSHSCAVGVDGFGYCWGSNDHYQIGVAVPNLGANKISLNQPLADIQAGDGFTCSLTLAGRVYCWGLMPDVLSSPTSNQTPSLITQLLDVRSIALTGDSVCAVTSGVYCWGGVTKSTTPVLIARSLGATYVAVGDGFACFVLATNVRCFGGNSKGQLGNGKTVETLETVDVSNLSNMKSLTLGSKFACALGNSNETFCWGDNSSGQISLVQGDQIIRVPSPFQGVADLDAGENYLCALLTNGEIACKGDLLFNQDGFVSSTFKPLQARFPALVKSVATGTSSSCTVFEDRSLQCFGKLALRKTAPKVYKSVSVGDVSACAVTESGSVACWGSNSAGQLGTDNLKSSAIPLLVIGLGNLTVNSISAGFRHVCAATSDGLVYCWGDNSKSQLGFVGPDKITASAVPGIGNAVSVSVGKNHSCALLSNAQTLCWGDNSKRQVSTSVSLTLPPTSRTFGAKSLVVEAGGLSTCYLNLDNDLSCFGDNTLGQSPSNVSGKFKSISVGETSACAISTTNDGLMCFGSNQNLQLGRQGLGSSSPSAVAGDLRSDEVSVGHSHVCAKRNNEVYCWGLNSYGELLSSFGFPDAFADAEVSISGKLNVGESISVTALTSERLVQSSITWFRSSSPSINGTVVVGQEANKYILGISDLGRSLSAGVTFKKWGVTSEVFRSASSIGIRAPIRLLSTPVPEISGRSKVGQVLLAKAGRWDSGVTLKFQWFRGNKLILGATRISFRITSAEVGKEITLQVTGQKGNLPKVTKKSKKTNKVSK
jgi:alpha-tubulin suppressor-like RCC1 family protein